MKRGCTEQLKKENHRHNWPEEREN